MQAQLRILRNSEICICVGGREIVWGIVCRYSPLGITFLIAGRIVGMSDPVNSFIQLGWYMMTVLIGLAIHEFITLTLIYFIFTRRNPFKLMLQMSQALLTALGTASR